MLLCSFISEVVQKIKELFFHKHKSWKLFHILCDLKIFFVWIPCFGSFGSESLAQSFQLTRVLSLVVACQLHNNLYAQACDAFILAEFVLKARRLNYLIIRWHPDALLYVFYLLFHPSKMQMLMAWIKLWYIM